MMKISIITSVYNGKDYIEKMIDSIINQTYKDWEMILIDDASDDGTWDIINRIFDKRIVKIRNQHNLGLTKSLNKALEFAKGKYILRMDADDIAMLNRIEVQMNFMDMNPEIVLSGCWMQCFGDMHDITKTHLNDDDIRIDLIFNSAIMHPTFIIRSEILKKYGLKYNENLKYAQDYDLTYQISKFGKLANIPQILVKYRVHSNQIGSTHYNRQREYADITRRNIVKDMGINLEDYEFEVWSDFCQGRIDKYSEQEKEILIRITKQFLYNNHLEVTYNNRKLEGILAEKIRVVITNEVVTINNFTMEAKKYKRLFDMMSRWMMLRHSGKSLIEWFISGNYQRIAIYGMGAIGECLIGELRNSSIHIVYGIDKNRWVRSSLRTVVSLEDELEKVDAIIITAVFYLDEIKKMLGEKIKCPLFSIEDIIYDIDL